jgi:hypothetical protein
MLDPTYFGYGEFRFSWGDHICAIFDNPTQQAEVMGGFMAQGLRVAQRCLWVAPPLSAARFRAALVEIGSDLATLESSGQLVVISELRLYLHNDLFEPERTMDLVRVLLGEGQRDGYPGMRIATDTSWLRERRVDPDLWEGFEGRVTQELAGLPAVMVCQFDRRQLSSAIVVAAFRTHPIVILGDTIHENPFYRAMEPRPIRAEDVM